MSASWVVAIMLALTACAPAPDAPTPSPEQVVARPPTATSGARPSESPAPGIQPAAPRAPTERGSLCAAELSHGLVRAVTPDDRAAVDAALGFPLPASPTCGFVDESRDFQGWGRVIYLELGGQPDAFGDLWEQLVRDDWRNLSEQGPPLFEQDGIQVALMTPPPGVFVMLP